LGRSCNYRSTGRNMRVPLAFQRSGLVSRKGTGGRAAFERFFLVRRMAA
jgi:hypothetical protein